MKKLKQFWHGDLLLQEVERVPLKSKKLRTNVIAMGEATNHAHRVDGGKCILWEHNSRPWNKDWPPTIIVEIVDPATLVHVDVVTGEMADHSPVELPVGIYEVIRQVELDPFTRDNRYVLD